MCGIARMLCGRSLGREREPEVTIRGGKGGVRGVRGAGRSEVDEVVPNDNSIAYLQINGPAP